MAGDARGRPAHVMRLAPAGWKAERLKASESIQSCYEETAVSDQESRSTWARAARPDSSLRCMKAARPGAPLECPRCHSPMNVIAVITDPQEARKILRHLVKVGWPPPGLDPSFV